jgi:dolichol-phosphate mannosyltransferase
MYSEELLVAEFHRRLASAVASLCERYAFEFLYVNDGSTDSTLAVLLQLLADDSRIRIVDFSRNFGHQRALTAGLDRASGAAVVCIDGDLQDPPELIPQLVAAWEAGAEVVLAKRRRRHGENWIKQTLAHGYYRVLQQLSDIRLPVDVGDFRLLDRVVLNVLKEMPEESRYLRGMVAWIGFRQTEVLYDRDPRYAGTPKFTFLRSLRLALDGIAGFSDRPLSVLAHIGLVITSLSFSFLCFVVLSKIFWPESSLAGWSSLIATISFFGGAQLLAMGVIGQYLGRVHREVKRRPLYVVRRYYAADSDSSSRNADVDGKAASETEAWSSPADDGAPEQPAAQAQDRFPQESITKMDALA